MRFGFGLAVLVITAMARPAHACKVALLPGAFEATSWVGKMVLRDEEYFREYREFFSSRGCEVLQLSFPPDTTIEQRGFLIRNRLNEGGPWQVIAHSQAGLDLRYAFQTLGLRPSRIKFVITIGTPHRGSSAAAWAMAHQRRGSLLSKMLALLGYDLAELRFLPEMEAPFLESRARYFAQTPPVPWFSAVGDCKTACHPGLRLLRWLSGPSGGKQDGDGMVEAQAQSFGETLGSFDLDHLSEVAAHPQKSAERRRLIEAISAVAARTP
jgi:hypothetical protein